jgi:hypothetical protein
VFLVQGFEDESVQMMIAAQQTEPVALAEPAQLSAL